MVFKNLKKIFLLVIGLKLLLKKLMKFKKEKKPPILVGGTGLYFKALTDGLVEIPLNSSKI